MATITYLALGFTRNLILPVEWCDQRSPVGRSNDTSTAQLIVEVLECAVVRFSIAFRAAAAHPAEVLVEAPVLEVQAHKEALLHHRRAQEKRLLLVQTVRWAVAQTGCRNALCCLFLESPASHSETCDQVRAIWLPTYKLPIPALIPAKVLRLVSPHTGPTRCSTPQVRHHGAKNFSQSSTSKQSAAMCE